RDPVLLPPLLLLLPGHCLLVGLQPAVPRGLCPHRYRHLDVSCVPRGYRVVTARQCRPGGRLLSRSAVLLYLFGAACRQAAPPLAAGAAEVPRLEPVATAPVMGLSVRSAVALGADGAWLFAAPRVTG